MKKAIQLFLLLFLMSSVGKAQVGHSYSIVPTNPTESDSIFLMCHVAGEYSTSYDASSVLASFSYNVLAASFHIYHNFSAIWAPQSESFSIYLGTKQVGDYEVICRLYSGFGCEPDYQLVPIIDTISFTVQEATDCNQIITELNIPLNLTQGWNMIGYTCVEPLNVIEAFSTVEDKIIIVKDNLGNSYLPDWEFNGIGDLEFAKGYQLKITEDISDFYFCPTLIYSE